MRTPDLLTHHRRLWGVAAGFLVWAGVIAVRIVDLQVLRHGEFARVAKQQQEHVVDVPAPRGDLFARDGSAIAMSVAVDTLFVTPRRIKDDGVAAAMLGPVVGLEPKEIRARLEEARRKHQGFVRLKRKLSRSESDELKSLKFIDGRRVVADWIEFEQESQRFYPKNSFAVHAVGIVDADERGESGIEQAYEKELRGEPGSARVVTDVGGRPFEMVVERAPVPGASLTLSIHPRIQLIAERELAAAVEKHQCKTGSVVVLDPRTGDVLAMASYPPMKRDDRPKHRDDPRWRNMALVGTSEPGSVFKVFTVALGLDAGAIRPNDVMPCGRLTLGKRTVHEAKHFFGPLRIEEILWHSSNVGAAQVGLRLGARRMHDGIERLGFGDRTGPEAANHRNAALLPGETPGIFADFDKWSGVSHAYMSFGHEIATTTVQLAQAFSAIANGGLLVKPRLVIRRQRPGAEPEEIPAEPGRRVLQPETAITVRRMTEGTVLHGTGKAAKLDGYTSCGKTGSAQIAEKGGYSHLYNASFMGAAPVTNPAVVAVVTLNGSRLYGGATAAPVWKTVVQEAMRVLDVPRDLPDAVPPPVVDQPQPETLVTETPQPEQVLSAAAFGPGRVPDFTGKSMREVVEQASSMGVPLALEGRGVARDQQPAPGSVLSKGARVRVQFRR